MSPLIAQTTQNPSKVYQVISLILGSNSVLVQEDNSVPPIFMPDYNLIQWGQHHSDAEPRSIYPFANFNLFLGSVSELTLQQYAVLLNRLVCPSLIREFINTIHQERNEDLDEAGHRIIDSVLTSSLDKLKQVKRCLYRIVLESRQWIYLEMLDLESAQELCDFLALALISHPKLITMNLRRIPRLKELFSEGLQNSIVKPQLLRCVVNFIDQVHVYHGSVEPKQVNLKIIILTHLADVLSEEVDYLRAGDLPRELIPFLPYAMVSQMILTLSDIRQMYFDGKWYRFSDIQELPVFHHLNLILSAAPQDLIPRSLLFRINQAYQECKLTHNAKLLRSSTNPSDLEDQLVFDQVEDLVKLFAQRRNIFVMNNNYFTLKSLLESEDFVNTLTECLHSKDSGTSIKFILTQCHQLAYDTQCKFPEKNLIVATLELIASSVIFKNIEQCLIYQDHVPIIYFLSLSDLLVDAYLDEQLEDLEDWVNMAKIISASLLSVPERLLKLMKMHLLNYEIELNQKLLENLHPILQYQLVDCYLNQGKNLHFLLGLKLSYLVMEHLIPAIMRRVIGHYKSSTDNTELLNDLFKHCQTHPKLLEDALDALPLIYWHLFLNASSLGLHAPSFTWLEAETPEERLAGLDTLLESDPQLKSWANHRSTYSLTYTHEALIRLMLLFPEDSYDPIQVTCHLTNYYSTLFSPPARFLPLPPTSWTPPQASVLNCCKL